MTQGGRSLIKQQSAVYLTPFCVISSPTLVPKPDTSGLGDVGIQEQTGEKSCFIIFSCAPSDLMGFESINT